MLIRPPSLFFCILILCSGSILRAQRNADFGRYQVILERQLLGRPAPVAPPSQPAPPPAAPPSWAVEYRLTMITEDLSSDRARVGLYHVRDQTAYLLIEGERYDHGFTLHSVNYDANQANISYQGAQHRFSLESAPIPAAAPAPQVTSRAPPNRSVRRVSQSSSSSPEPPSEPPAEPRFSSPEELQAHLQNVQMDAIRTGKPPLPIPLTPEMDAQLVQEGVLPPLEE